jgi:hypothetical protein
MSAQMELSQFARSAPGIFFALELDSNLLALLKGGCSTKSYLEFGEGAQRKAAGGSRIPSAICGAIGGFFVWLTKKALIPDDLLAL